MSAAGTSCMSRMVVGLRVVVVVVLVVEVVVVVVVVVVVEVVVGSGVMLTVVWAVPASLLASHEIRDGSVTLTVR